MSKAIDLDAILARANAATPGPWAVKWPPPPPPGRSIKWPTIVHPVPATGDEVDDDDRHVTDLDDCIEKSDAAFIAAAREDVPDLVAAVRDRDAEIATLKARLAMATRFALPNGGSIELRHDGTWNEWDAAPWAQPRHRIGTPHESAAAAFDVFRARTTEKP